jgi:VanZ family protein
VAPEDSFPLLSLINDKVFHALEYLILFLVTVHAVKSSKSVLQPRAALAALLYCFVIGGLTEGLQFLTPDRSPDLKDWAADLLGAGLGFLLFKMPGEKTP